MLSFQQIILTLQQYWAAQGCAPDEGPPVPAGLFTDLDLSEANLPPGTVLAIGTCELEISSDPHRPCRLFENRYGVGAVKRVKRGNAKGARTRGVLATCVKAGTIHRGDAIEVRRKRA